MIDVEWGFPTGVTIYSDGRAASVLKYGPGRWALQAALYALQ